MPTNFTGAPVTLPMESAAPPRASPSSLVRMTPVRPRRLWNSPAERTASWPIMASATKQNFGGLQFALAAWRARSSSSSSMCRRPAVSTRITSEAESFASRIAPRTISSGLSVPVPGQQEHADGFGDLRELFARGGTIDVGGNDDRTMAMRAEPLAELAGGGGLAGALQADDHPDRRRPRGEQRRLVCRAAQQFVANDLDDLLVGRKLQQDFGAEGFLANVRERVRRPRRR